MTVASSHETAPVLRVDSLDVIARDRRRGNIPIVQDISFAIAPGKVTAFIGESGSGKTTIALACLGFARAGCEVVGGDVWLDDVNILKLSRAQRRLIRGQQIAYIAQSAASAFNAALTLNRQVCEPAVIRGQLDWSSAEAKAIELYRELDLPDPEHIGNRYPHQVSGGQLQRLMAAMAMICDPKLLILDEPTTALDVTTQIEVLRSFKRLIRRRGTSAIYVSHDLAVVAQIADDILVLRDGCVVERGSVEDIIERPQQEYTRELIGAAHIMPETIPPSRSSSSLSAGSEAHPEQTVTPLVQVKSITAGYGRRQQHVALSDVSLDVFAGRTIGVIGESGSGKTTLGRVISGLMAPRLGDVILEGQTLNRRIEGRSKQELRQIQMAFQMADVALNPKHRIDKILGRPLAFYFDYDNATIQRRVQELLDLVELPADYASRYPRQLSGGQRQRVNLARALAAEPKLIICDEITSALDTVVAKAILKLLKDLQTKLDIGYLFISHDLSTIVNVADTVAVMKEGQIVEYGSTQEIMTPPHHDYTQLLLASVPQLRSDWLDSLNPNHGQRLAPT